MTSCWSRHLRALSFWTALSIAIAVSSPTRADAPDMPAYSAAGLYNLANSYARDGKPGMAVLNYERARLVAPYDPDIEFNLRFVRDSARLPQSPPTRFERAARIASPSVIAWGGLAGLLIGGLSLLAGQFSSRYPWLRRVLLGCGAALLGLTLANAAVLWPTLHSAVVIANATPARVSPVPMGDPLFVLPEAETVRMLAEHEGFVLIRSRTGQTGWVAHANLAPIVPRH
jgi:hypothetical protein